MKCLEDEPDLVASQPGEGALGELVDAPLTQPQLPGRRSVESAEQVKECRLAAAARPPHGQGFASGDLQVDVVDGTNEALAAAVVLAQGVGSQQRSVASLIVHRPSFRSSRIASGKVVHSWWLRPGNAVTFLQPPGGYPESG